jgi:hypothetical protein
MFLYAGKVPPSINPVISVPFRSNTPSSIMVGCSVVISIQFVNTGGAGTGVMKFVASGLTSKVGASITSVGVMEDGILDGAPLRGTHPTKTKASKK